MRAAALRYAPLALFAGLGAVFAVQLLSERDTALPSPLIGKPAPALDLPTLDGGRLSMADLVAGKPTLLNFFASWCAPCRIEHPHLMALAARDDIRLVGVAYHDAPADAQRFLDELGNPFAKAGVDAEGRVALDWGLAGVPETFVLDGAGVVVWKHTGPIDAADLTATIEPAIARAAAR